jgi:hypothetical protein
MLEQAGLLKRHVPVTGGPPHGHNNQGQWPQGQPPGASQGQNQMAASRSGYPQQQVTTPRGGWHASESTSAPQQGYQNQPNNNRQSHAVQNPQQQHGHYNNYHQQQNAVPYGRAQPHAGPHAQGGYPSVYGQQASAATQAAPAPASAWGNAGPAQTKPGDVAIVAELHKKEMEEKQRQVWYICPTCKATRIVRKLHCVCMYVFCAYVLLCECIKSSLAFLHGLLFLGCVFYAQSSRST